MIHLIMHIDAFYQFVCYHPRFDNINKMTPTTTTMNVLLRLLAKKMAHQCANITCTLKVVTKRREICIDILIYNTWVYLEYIGSSMTQKS